MVTDQGLYGFIVPGPKRSDLHRDSRYSLHSETCPPPRHEDAFSVSGRVVFLDDRSLRDALTRQLLVERGLDVPYPGFEALLLDPWVDSSNMLLIRRGRSVSGR